MRNFNMLAAVAAAMLMGGGVSAKEKSDQPKPKKVCRTEQMSGRITPQRVCRIIPPSDTSAEDGRRKAGDARGAGNDRS
jgi:hypothetical protein